MAAYTAIDDPEAYFQADLYTGNGTAIGSGGLTGTFDGDTDLQADFFWFKKRSAAGSHFLFSSPQGVTNRLSADTTEVENAYTESLSVINSDGFTIGNIGDMNTSSATHVCWAWKANGSGSSNTAGSINTTATSANTTSGFSISTYTGTGSTATLGHGLGVAPGMIIIKQRNGTADWQVYNRGSGATRFFILNTHAEAGTDTNRWNDTSPTSTLFTVGTTGNVNGSSDTYVAYAWAGIQGFSKFGSYEGNGNADGTFVYLGFRPAYVLTKSIDTTSGWHIFDNKRLGYNVDNNPLTVEGSGGEATTDMIDMLSNGFKCRTASDPNVAETYIYAAFAEAPLVNSEGVPCNAR